MRRIVRATVADGSERRIEWEADRDRAYCDPYTAAMLTLGEAYLHHVTLIHDNSASRQAIVDAVNNLYKARTEAAAIAERSRRPFVAG